MDGLIERMDDESGKYHDILAYRRELTDKELSDYELDYIGKEINHGTLHQSHYMR